MAQFAYPITGKQADGHFKYVVVVNDKPMFFHRKEEIKDINGVKYQWDKEANEYQLINEKTRSK